MNLEFQPLDLHNQIPLLQDLLKKGFPDSDIGLDFSPEMLIWKFSESFQHGLSHIGLVDGVAASFYGVLPRKYSFEGANCEIGLVVDVLSVPAMRGKGLFVSSGINALKVLETTGISSVIGFPIRPEVLPGHLKVGWKVNFSMPVYVYPIGSGPAHGFLPNIKKVILKFLYKALTPLRFSPSRSVSELSVNEFVTDKDVQQFFSGQTVVGNISLVKNPDFLKWRLSKPNARYTCFVLRGTGVSATAVVRIMNIGGFQTLAIVDLESLSVKNSKTLMSHIAAFAATSRCDLIGFCSNKSNFKRLGLRRFGFLNSPKKFKVITRSIGQSNHNLVEQFTRITWLDSDTV